MKNFHNTSAGKALVGLGLVAGLVAAPAIATAASLDMGLQLRYRGEVDMRDFDEDTSEDIVNSQRTRLNAKVDHERYHAFLQIQDVRVWGEEDEGGDPTLTDASADGLDMHQAFFKVDDVFGSGIGVQVGRQEINFADERLVGAVDWTQNARSLDGFVFSKAFGDTGVVVPFILQLREDDDAGKGAGLRQADVGTDEGEDNDLWAAGFHSIWNVAEDQSFQPHLYYVRDGGPNLNLYTLGFYYDGKAGDLMYDFTADWQTGDVMLGGADVDWNAYLLAANVGFQSGPFMVGGGIDYLSGDDDTSDDDVESFTTLLATNHKFYGYMDYFNPNILPTLGGTDGLSGLGLIDYHLKAWYTFGGSTKAGVDAHYFTTAEEDETVLHDDNGDAVDTYGTEIDFGFKTKSGPLDIYAGYSVFFQDEAMEARFHGTTGADNNDDIAHWAFVMASINFP
jgi:hypothetical protein